MGLLGAGAISAITRSPAAVKLLTQGMTKMLGPGRSSAPAVAKAAQAGAHVTSAEMVLFEMLGQAGGPEFKAISALVR